MDRNRKVTIIFCLAIVFFGFTGCQRTTEEDLVGVWYENCDCTSIQDNRCGTIELLEDGHFQARSLPGENFIDSSSTQRIDGYGTWKIDETDKDPYNIKLWLSFLDKRVGDISVRISTLDNPDALFVGVDDNVVIFKLGLQPKTNCGGISAP